MTILILGANGFIGSAVLARLGEAGYHVTGLGRDIAHAKNRFPRVHWLRADLATLTLPERWTLDALAGGHRDRCQLRRGASRWAS